MIRKLIKTSAALLSAALLAILGTAEYIGQSLPENFYVAQGQELSLNLGLPLTSAGFDETELVKSASQNKTEPANVQIKLFGLIPVKTARVEAVERLNLVPCGTPFGVKLCTEGVLVVGMNDIPTASGLTNPAKSCGVKLGDVILTVGGEKVSSNEEVAKQVEKSGGKPLSFSILRENTPINLTLTPVKCSTDNQYKAGLWVRDSSAGIGTMTFYSPEQKRFGGLGHAICDVDTGQIMPVHTGEIVDVAITGITKGAKGAPGELKGRFVTDDSSGAVSLNTETGIFGTLTQPPVTSQKAIPIALKQEIKEGKATILTTLSGNTPQEYQVTIDKVSLNSNQATKNMVIKITDPRLLEETGGIVQGMSGSPILQNGKLIGAVTHVFVNDPTKGYGIFIENMVDTMNVLQKSEKKQAS